MDEHNVHTTICLATIMLLLSIGPIIVLAQVPPAPLLTDEQLERLHKVKAWDIDYTFDRTASQVGSGDVPPGYQWYGRNIDHWDLSYSQGVHFRITLTVAGKTHQSDCGPGSDSCLTKYQYPASVTNAIESLSRFEEVHFTNGCLQPDGQTLGPGKQNILETHTIAGTKFLDGTGTNRIYGGSLEINYASNPPVAQADPWTSGLLGEHTIAYEGCYRSDVSTFGRMSRGFSVEVYPYDPDNAASGDTQVRIENGLFVIQGSSTESRAHNVCPSAWLTCDSNLTQIGGGQWTEIREWVIREHPDSAISVDIADPNPILLADDGAIFNDIEGAAKIPAFRIGTVADGVSKLLLIAHWDNGLKFAMEGKDSSDVSDGTLSALGSSDTGSTSVTVPSVMTADGKSVVIAVYTPPPSYGNITGYSHSVYVVMTDVQNPATGSQIVPIMLERPPVVLVHGLWSNPMLWIEGGFLDTLASHGFRVFLADYASASSATFDPTANSKPGILSVKLRIIDALNNYHARSIACAQADVIGHSMGGLMTRGLIQQPDYLQLTNYKRGWVHRLITIGTPHLGSPLAKIIWDNRNVGVSITTGESNTVGNLLASAGMPVDQGAIEGFIPGSIALSHLQATKVKSHAIVATWAPGAVASATTLQTALQILTTDISLDVNMVFGESDYDLIVGSTSEYGGLSPGAQFTSFFPSTIHAALPLITAQAGELTETSNPLIMQKVVSLLSSSNPDDFTDGFPQPLPNQIPSPVLSSGTFVTGVQKNLTGGLHITAPASGTVYDHRDSTTITFSAEATGGASVQRIVYLVEGIGGGVPPVAPPYSTSFTLPRSAPIGNIRVVALALDSTNALLADTSIIIIKAPSTLYGITVQPTKLALTSDNRSQQLLVLGTFNRSGATTIQLNISQRIQGTTYTMRHGYASATPDGIVSAVSDGVDTLEVHNSVFAVLVPVDVRVGPTASLSESALPAHFHISQNYPNPFNPTTVIQYEIPGRSHVTLTVYDILGRRVATLVNDFREAGRYNVMFNGRGLASGMYLYRLQAGNFVSVKKMLVIK